MRYPSKLLEHFEIYQYPERPQHPKKTTSTAIIENVSYAPGVQRYTSPTYPDPPSLYFPGIALLVEISTHFIVWRGMACFHLSPFVEVPARMVNTLNKPAAAIYPSSSNRRQLLANDSNGSPKASSGGCLLRRLLHRNALGKSIGTVVRGGA